MEQIQYTAATAPTDLESILRLQHQNLRAHLSVTEAASDGFLSLAHDLDLLARMHAEYPHTVAKAGDQVVGYTLSMPRSFAQEIEMLVPMFEHIDALSYDGFALADAAYIVMGQVCVDKQYRGQGVFAGLYAEMQRAMQPYFDYIITEIAEQNHRSLRAHQKVGFIELDRYTSEGITWVLVLLPTRFEGERIVSKSKN